MMLKEFETAIQLDNDYSIAKENLFTDIALNYLGETVRFKLQKMIYFKIIVASFVLVVILQWKELQGQEVI